MQGPVKIDWHYEGRPDYSSGTGAYGSEKALAYSAALVMPAFVVYALVSGRADWNAFQIAVALLLAADIGGGLVSNALNACKRFYHTPPKPEEGRAGALLKRPLVFAMIHVHPLAAGLLFDGGNWRYGLFWYAAYAVSVVAVLRTPLYLKRPVSMLLIMLALAVNLYVYEPIPGLEWLMPLLFVKIVYGHLVREEPYRR